MASSISVSSLSLALSSSSSVLRSDPAPRSLRFCGLRRETLGFQPLRASSGSIRVRSARRSIGKAISALSAENGSAASKDSFDYDLIIIGAGVGLLMKMKMMKKRSAMVFLGIWTAMM